jgi:ABC-2 type transport system permease protein
MKWRAVRSIAREELRESIGDKRFRWTTVVVTVLLVGSLTFGVRHYLDLSRAHEAALHANTEQFNAQSPKNPHAGAHFGIDAFRPEPLLSFLDRGIDDQIGEDIFLEPHHPNLFANPPSLDSLATSRVGGLSGAEIAIFTLPLLVIALATACITKERERGTLRLLLAQGVSKLEIAAGKTVGIATLLGIVLAPPLVVIATALLALGAASAPDIDAIRIAMILGGFATYVLIFLLICVAISAVASSSRAALLLALGTWGLFVLVVPRIVDQVVRASEPTISVVQLKHEIQTDPTEPMDLLRLDSGIEKFQADTLAKYGVSRIEDLPVNIAGLELEDAEVGGNRVFDRHYEAMFDQLRAQDRITREASVLSPAAALGLLSSSAAGTDLDHRLDWWRSAETHRRRINTILNNYFATHSTSKQGFGFTVGRDAFELVPPWHYDQPPGTWALDRSLPALAALALWCMVAVGLWFAGAQRMRAL